MQDESTIGLPCPTGVFQGARRVVSVKVKDAIEGLARTRPGDSAPWSSAPSRGGFRVYAGLLLMRRGDQQHASPVCERRGEEYLSPVIVNDFGVCNRPRDKKAASDYLAHRAHTRNDGAGLRD